jgi:triosephosphate isomerase (TIM)
MSRKLHIYGNWKLNNTVKESEDLAKAVVELSKPYGDKVAIGFAPVFTSLYPVKKILENSHVSLLAQNGYPKPNGAFTGEVSFPLLVDAGCDGVLIGHSERRHLFQETNELVGEKIESALQSGLQTILCLGERLEERESGKTWEVIKGQLDTAMFHVPPSSRDKVIIAYEPVWAIGTGKTASPEQAQEIHALIREQISKSWLEDAGKKIIILYGGSMKPSNAKELLSMPDIDGGLIGGASLKPESFFEIIKIAGELEK